MHEILAYLNRVTLGTLTESEIEQIKYRARTRCLVFSVAKPAILCVNGTRNYSVQLETIVLFRGSKRWQYPAHLQGSFSGMDLKDRQTLYRHAGDVRSMCVHVQDLPVLTCEDLGQCVWIYADELLQVTGPWLETENQEFHALCRKYWPT